TVRDHPPVRKRPAAAIVQRRSRADKGIVSSPQEAAATRRSGRSRISRAPCSCGSGSWAVNEVIQRTIGGEVAVECCTELSARACVTCWTPSRIQASAGPVTDKALEEI